VESGRVVVYDGISIEMGPDGSPPAGLPMVGRPDQINGVAATLGQAVRPGDVARFQAAFDSTTPRTDERVIFCNGEGQYAAGRRAVLTFDR
jgi:hypothetical protein